MDQHPIQGGVEILSVASCYRNQDKLLPDRPPGLNADFTLPTTRWLDIGQDKTESRSIYTKNSQANI